MSIDRFLSRNGFPVLLVLLHTLMIGAFAWIELDDAWNDMNPTMLVMAAASTLDAPIHWVLAPFISFQNSTGTYLAALLVVGGLFWFVIGKLVSFACQTIWHLPVWRRRSKSAA